MKFSIFKFKVQSKHVISLQKTKAAMRLKYSEVLKLGRRGKTSLAFLVLANNSI